MLGHKAKIFKTHLAISIDDLVPLNNFYRKVEAKVDLTFVRDLVKDSYSSRMGLCRLLTSSGMIFRLYQV